MLLRFSLKQYLQKFAVMQIFSPSLTEIFSPLEKFDADSVNKTDILKRSELGLEETNTNKATVILTADKLYVSCGSAGSFEVQINFLLKFERIIQKDSQSIAKKLGFKLTKDGTPTVVFFYSADQQLVEEWLLVLSHHLSQLGFHEQFKAIKRLGKGQFATVFQVEHLESGRKLAVKAFSKAYVKKTPKGIESLINEIKIMRSFAHKNLQKLEGIFQSDNSIYVITELLRGGSLFERLQKISQAKSRVDIESVREFMAGLLDGLRELGKKGIAHRDLKLDNIMLRSQSNFEPVIIDFGLATFVDDHEYLYYRCGTPGYVSPQVLASTKNQKIETISDMFSAGSILHHLLISKPLFEGTTSEEVLQKNKALKFDLSSPAYVGVDESGMDLLRRLLSVDPKLRIDSDEATKHEFLNLPIKNDSPVSTVCYETHRTLEEELSF